MSAHCHASASPERYSVLPACRRMRSAEPRFFAQRHAHAGRHGADRFRSFVDAAHFLGIDVWIKPLKFEFALVRLYSGRLPSLRGSCPRDEGQALVSGLRSTVVGAIVAEMNWIGGAAALGTASHFNQTPFGSVIYPADGPWRGTPDLATAVYAFHIARNPSTGLSPALKEAMVIGLALVLPLTLVTAGTMSALGGISSAARAATLAACR